MGKCLTFSFCPASTGFIVTVGSYLPRHVPPDPIRAIRF